MELDLRRTLVQYFAVGLFSVQLYIFIPAMRTIKYILIGIVVVPLVIAAIFSPYITVLLIVLGVCNIIWTVGKMRKQQQHIEALNEYIKQNEGKRFFFYTRRKKLLYALDNIIIPNLPADVQPVDIADKSGILFWLAHTTPHVPVPFILTITNGQVHKRSINSQLYHAIKHGKDVREVKVV